MNATALEELTPHYGWRSYWLNVLMLQVLALLFACPLVLAATWPKVGEAVVGFAGAAVCTLPFCLVFGWTHQSYSRKRAVRARVWYDRGGVNCIADSTIHSAQLTQCRWWYGDQTQATHPPRDPFLSGGAPAILIEFPPEFITEEREWKRKRYPAGPLVVAAGFLPETRRTWESLLRESGAVHDQERQALSAPLSNQAAACLAILAFPACAFAGIYGSKAVGHLLIGLGVPRDIALAISFPLFFPGCVYLIAYCFLLLSLHERRCALTVEQGRAAVEDWKPKARWFTVLAMMLLGIWGGNRLNLTWKVIGTVVNLLMTASITLHLHFLLKDPKSELTD